MKRKYIVLKTKSLKELAVKMNEMSGKRQTFFVVVNFLGTEYDILPLEKLADNNVYIDFEGTRTDTQEIVLEKQIMSLENYKKQFEIVKSEILYGNSYLCNLTVQTPIRTQYSLHEIFKKASSKYKVLYKNDWLSFSPETFIKIDHRGISSNPMKGTIDANLANAEKKLLTDPKEIAEHYTIVDLIRNDLSMVAKNVAVQKFRYITKVETKKGDLLQTSSKIVGELEDNYLDNLGTIFCTLLPAGSISGAPKKKTVEIITQAESYNRNFYTGVAGVFDGVKFDSCVLIRFIEKTEIGLVYKSGGGITKYSEAEKEYEEVKQKIYVPIA